MKKLLPVGATILFWSVAYGVVVGCVARVYAITSGMSREQFEAIDLPSRFLISVGVSFFAFAVLLLLHAARDRIIGKAK